MIAIQQLPTLTDQILAVSQPYNKGKDLHVLRQMYVREVGFEDAWQWFELETDVVFEVVFEDVDLIVADIGFCMVKRRREDLDRFESSIEEETFVEVA